ncbi:uncharacterized protein C1orf100 [Astyanax mexicanus]|uniref:uncharacterized protein C1orf100 n=1 Tax=Astyanax mexicanus TaxID=7994 RepID=UPI0020CB4A2E|nr:uncharacterized protein C1orf100 [Astyanax mexicanus]
MAGIGVAVRLHEFKESRGANQHYGSAEGDKPVLRQGRDVIGLYPGQLARVHTIHSPLYRPRMRSVKGSPRPEKLEERYQRNFDLLTLQTLDQSTAVQRATHTPHTHSTHSTTYREEFGRQSCFYPPDDTKFTLRSCPAPLDC